MSTEAKPGGMFSGTSGKQFKGQLVKIYKWYTGGFLFFLVALAIAEQMGLPKLWIGYTFLLATVGLYAGIGFMARTSDAAEYYVAGRRVPALFNGMATGADWMSAASFIGMAGTLYLTGFYGLSFIMGWTGGYCLVALFLAPYLRKFGQFTIPDFLGARYGGHIPRAVGIFAAILCSFTYVVAQIYGVGLITARMVGVEFEVGIFALRPGFYPGLFVFNHFVVVFVRFRLFLSLNFIRGYSSLTTSWLGSVFFALRPGFYPGLFRFNHFVVASCLCFDFVNFCFDFWVCYHFYISS